MTMRASTQPLKANSSSTSLSLPPWNRSSHATASQSVKGGDAQRKQRSPTIGNRKSTASFPPKPPTPTPRTPQHALGAPTESIQSPNAYELMTLNVPEGGIYNAFLGNDHHYGPVVPPWAESECSASCLDVDTDTQLHQLMLRVAATRDVLRHSASQATTQEMRRAINKGQHTNHGVIRCDVRSIHKTTARKHVDDGDGGDDTDWQPPQVLIRFPWETAAGNTRPEGEESAEMPSHPVPPLPALERRETSTDGRAQQRSSYSAYHRYFVGANGDRDAPTAAAPNGKANALPYRTRNDVSPETTASHHKSVVKQGRYDDAALGTRSQRQERQRRLFDPNDYAQMILRRGNGEPSRAALDTTCNVRDDHSHTETAGYDVSWDRHASGRKAAALPPHSSTTFLLSPPRDDDDGSVFFDAPKGQPNRPNVSLELPAVDNGLVETPRGEASRCHDTTRPVAPAPLSSDLRASSTNAPDGMPRTSRPSEFWAPSAAVAFECINFASTSNPVFMRMPSNSGNASRTTSVSQSVGSMMMVDDMLKLLTPR